VSLFRPSSTYYTVPGGCRKQTATGPAAQTPPRGRGLRVFR